RGDDRRVRERAGGNRQAVGPKLNLATRSPDSLRAGEGLFLIMAYEQGQRVGVGINRVISTSRRHHRIGTRSGRAGTARDDRRGQCAWRKADPYASHAMEGVRAARGAM